MTSFNVHVSGPGVSTVIRVENGTIKEAGAPLKWCLGFSLSAFVEMAKLEGWKGRKLAEDPTAEMLAAARRAPKNPAQRAKHLEAANARRLDALRKQQWADAAAICPGLEALADELRAVIDATDCPFPGVVSFDFPARLEAHGLASAPESVRLVARSVCARFIDRVSNRAHPDFRLMPWDKPAGLEWSHWIVNATLRLR